MPTKIINKKTLIFRQRKNDTTMIIAALCLCEHKMFQWFQELRVN